MFIERDLAEDILLLWNAKKNVILQGPPGVGKSYAAQRLAYALMGAKDRDRLRFVQFHHLEVDVLHFAAEGMHLEIAYDHIIFFSF